MNASHNRFRHPRQIQREIDISVRFRNNLLCHIVTADGKRRYQHFPLRHDFFYFFYNRTGRYNLAYRRAMDPDTVSIHHIRNLFPADQPHALPEPGAEALFRKKTVNAKWQYQDEKCQQP